MSMRNPTIMDCGVYSITSPSGKKYIGSSNNIPRRWNSHKRDLIKGSHHSPFLQNAWNKYSGDLEFKVILICEEKNLQMYEQLFLDNYKPEYNISPTAYSCRGIKRSEEFKNNLRKIMMGNTYMVGRKLSEETKKKVGLASKGNQYAKGGCGYIPTEEHRKNLSRAGMGHPVSEETRRKIGEASRAMWARKKAEKNNVSL